MRGSGGCPPSEAQEPARHGGSHEDSGRSLCLSSGVPDGKHPSDAGGLKEKGFWVVGADMDGESLYYEANLKGPLVIVMGAEGKGVSPLTRKLCDFCVRIPMKGKVSSLNVSVAAALLIYEAAKQRGE